MNPLDHKKNWLAFLAQLKAGQPLQPEQCAHLAKVLEDILVNDVDAKEAMGLKYSRGHSKADAEARKGISYILQWVSCATKPLSEGGRGLTLADAFEQAAIHFSQFGYEPELIEKYWYQKDKWHMHSTERQHFDQDSPF